MKFTVLSLTLLSATSFLTIDAKKKDSQNKLPLLNNNSTPDVSSVGLPTNLADVTDLDLENVELPIELLDDVSGGSLPVEMPDVSDLPNTDLNVDQVVALVPLSPEDTEKLLQSLTPAEQDLLKQCVNLVLSKIGDLDSEEAFKQLKEVLSEKYGQSLEMILQVLFSVYKKQPQANS